MYCNFRCYVKSLCLDNARLTLIEAATIIAGCAEGASDMLASLHLWNVLAKGVDFYKSELSPLIYGKIIVNVHQNVSLLSLQNLLFVFQCICVFCRCNQPLYKLTATFGELLLCRFKRRCNGFDFQNCLQQKTICFRGLFIIY